MEEILNAFHLDKTFFIQFALFVVLFFALKIVYFSPFMKLIALRHEKTVATKEEAERMLKEATAKFEEYQTKLTAKKAEAKQEFDALIEAAKKEDAKTLAAAREEAKKITQQSLEQIASARAELEKQLNTDVEILAHKVVEKLTPKRG